MNTLYDQILRYYNGLPTFREGQKEFIIKLLDRISPDSYKSMFLCVRDTCDRFPSEKQLKEILRHHKEFYIPTTRNYDNPNKQMEWRSFKKLFPNNYENGMVCIICQTPIEVHNCFVTEKDDEGNDVTQICACCGNDPTLQYLDEWKAWMTNHKSIISYQIFYWHYMAKG